MVGGWQGSGSLGKVNSSADEGKPSGRGRVCAAIGPGARALRKSPDVLLNGMAS